MKFLQFPETDLTDPPNITDIFIDTVGDPETYKSRLVAALGKDFGRFVIEKKADATYKVVSAASIVAKVTSTYHHTLVFDDIGKIFDAKEIAC